MSRQALFRYFFRTVPWNGLGEGEGHGEAAPLGHLGGEGDAPVGGLESLGRGHALRGGALDEGAPLEGHLHLPPGGVHRA